MLGTHEYAQKLTLDASGNVVVSSILLTTHANGDPVVIGWRDYTLLIVSWAN